MLLRVRLGLGLGAVCSAAKYSLIQRDAVLLVKFEVRNGTGRQYTYTTARALIYFMEDALIDGFGDFVGDEALPFEEPVRADHVPRVHLGRLA